MKSALRFERKYMCLIKNVLGVESEIMNINKKLFLKLNIITQVLFENIFKS